MIKKIVKFAENRPGIFGLIVAIIVIAGLFTASWGATCLIVYLIMLCFKLHFTLAIGTGIWLILLILHSIAGSARNK